MAIIDMEGRCGYLSPEIAFYFQPETFQGGTLEATREPARKNELVQWRVPDCLERFSRFELHWTARGQQVGAGDGPARRA